MLHPSGSSEAWPCRNAAVFPELGGSGSAGFYRVEVILDSRRGGGLPSQSRLAAANAYTEEWNFPPSSDFKWLSTDAMDDAAANNQLGVVQWLHLNRAEGCTTKAMDEAAGSGHLEVAKWLHMNRSEGCTVRAVDEAAANGHHEVVKWLLANRSEGYTNPRVGFTSLYEHAEVVKCLVVQQSPRTLKKIAMEKASHQGNLALVQWLSTKVNAPSTVRAMISAAKEGHLKILQYLHSRRPKAPSLRNCAFTAQSALDNDHLRSSPCCVLVFATLSGQSIEISRSTRLEMLLFLHAHYPESSPQRMWKQFETRWGHRGRLASLASGSTPKFQRRLLNREWISEVDYISWLNQLLEFCASPKPRHF